MGIQNLIAEGDSMKVIREDNMENKMTWNATLIIRDAKCIMNSLNDIRIQHIYRKDSQVVETS